MKKILELLKQMNCGCTFHSGPVSDCPNVAIENKIIAELTELKEAANEYIEWADEGENHIETMLFREAIEK